MKNVQAKKVLILGATSLIAQEVCKLLAAQQCRLFLVGRDANKLAAIGADLKVRAAVAVGTSVADLSDTTAHERILDEATRFLGGLDIALIAYGVLGDQNTADGNWSETLGILDANFVSAASWAFHLANRFEASGEGQLVAIGSVAGDRGKKNNYTYGAAKAGLDVFLQGIRHRLASKGINILLVKPGYVDTPMTAKFQKSPLFASAARVAGGIVSAMEARKSLVYVPWYWRYIMLIVRNLPEAIFNKAPI